MLKATICRLLHTILWCLAANEICRSAEPANLDQVVKSIKAGGAEVEVSGRTVSEPTVAIVLEAGAEDEQQVGDCLGSVALLSDTLDSLASHSPGLLGAAYFSLSLSGAGVTDRSLGRLANVSRLGELIISESPVTEVGLAVLRTASTLRRIRIEKTDVADSGLSHLASSLGLRRLELYQNMRITGTGLTSVKDLKHLTSLVIGVEQISDEGMQALGRLVRLEFLGIHAADITNAGMAHLQNLRELRTLELSLNKIDGNGLSVLRNLKSLSTLRIQDEDFTEKGLEGLDQALGLNELVLIRAQIDDASVRAIGNIRQLTVLRLIECPRVTSNGLRHLGALSRLKYVELSGGWINDGGVKAFAGLDELERIRLVDTSVSDEAITRLQSKMKHPPIIEKAFYPRGRNLHLLGDSDVSLPDPGSGERRPRSGGDKG